MSVQFVRWVFGANQHRATSLCFLSEHTSEHNGTRLENSSVIFLHEPTCCACVVSKQHHCKSIFSQPLLCLNSPSPRSTLCLWRQLTLTLLLVPHLALPQQHVPLLSFISLHQLQLSLPDPFTSLAATAHVWKYSEQINYIDNYSGPTVQR